MKKFFADTLVLIVLCFASAFLSVLNAAVDLSYMLEVKQVNVQLPDYQSRAVQAYNKKAGGVQSVPAIRYSNAEYGGRGLYSTANKSVHCSAPRVGKNGGVVSASSYTKAGQWNGVKNTAVYSVGSGTAVTSISSLTNVARYYSSAEYSLSQSKEVLYTPKRYVPVIGGGGGEYNGDNQNVDTTTTWYRWLKQYFENGSYNGNSEGTAYTSLSEFLAAGRESGMENLEEWWDATYGSGYTPDIFTDFETYVSNLFPVDDCLLPMMMVALIASAIQIAKLRKRKKTIIR